MKNIGAYFKAVAQANLTESAIKNGDDSYSYGIIDRWASNLAAYIHGQVGQHKVVATFIPASVEYITAILAVNISGNAFMPIDRKLPALRIEKLLDFTNPAVIITNTTDGLEYVAEETIIILMRIVGQAILLKRREGNEWVTIDISQPVPAPLHITIDNGSAAYLINTSGTTSEPKTIVGRNDSLSHFIHWQINEYGLEKVRGGFVTSIGFDVSLRDIFTPLLSAGELIIPSDSVKENIVELNAWIKTEQIQLLHLVPSIFRLITGEGLAEGQHSLKYVFLAGEALYWKDVQDWVSTAGDKTKLINLYGPSETTLARLFYNIPLDAAVTADRNSIVSLGKPIADSKVFISKNGIAVPDGEKGEICLFTAFSSNGYLKNEKLNANKFRNLTVSQNESVLVYYTGDMGYRQDGIVHFSGRIDNQVKIAGNRVELLDIQLNLLSLPAIKEAFILVDDSDTQHLKIVAFYIPSASVKIDIVRTHLKNNLPVYMEPHYLYELDVFPLNINGKIDGHKLKEYHIAQSRERAINVHAEVVDELSAGVLELIRKVVPRLPQEPDKTLMELGVSSLKAIQILATIFKQYRVKIPLVFILNNGISNIANYIKEHTIPREEEKIEKTSSAKYFVSPTQEQMLFASYFNEKSNLAYNVLLAYRISGKLDADKLKSFAIECVRNHEIFRTSYHFANNTFVQDIHEEVTNDLFKHVGVNAGAVDDYINAELGEGFNLTKDKYLLKIILLTISDSESVIIFKTHHITVDIQSLQFIKEQFLDYYTSNVTKEKEEKVQYKQFSETYNSLLKPSETIASKQFWVNKFRRVKNFELPLDFERPAFNSFTGKNERLELGTQLSKDILEFAKAHNCSLFMFYITVLSILLRKYARSNDVVFGIPMTLRDVGETYNSSIGFFLNTLPIKIEVDDKTSFSSFLKNQSEAILEFYSHKHYPFSYIVDDLHIKHDPNKNPVFNYMVVGIETTTDEDGTSISNGLSFESIRHNDNTSKFDLSFFIVNSEGQLKLQVEYNIGLYKQKTIVFLLEQLKQLLVGVISRPHDSVADFQLADYSFGLSTPEALGGAEIASPEFTILPFSAERTLLLPKTKMETQLFNIWKELLAVNELSITDNFFDIGGTSMKAINLITVINTEFDKAYTIMDLFVHSNIQAFAGFMEANDVACSFDAAPVENAVEQMDEALKILNMNGHE